MTESNRDRVRQVVTTAVGRDWINEHCGSGAITDLGLSWCDPTDLLQPNIET